MNRFNTAFDALYSCQTRTIGVAILATVGTFAVNKPAILHTVTSDDIVLLGGTGEKGGYRLQMKATDFVSAPPYEAAVTVNGDATGEQLQVILTEVHSGIRHLIVGDMMAMNA